MDNPGTVLKDLDLSDFTVQIQVCRLRKLTDWVVRDGYAPYWRFYINGDRGAVIQLDNQEYAIEPGNFYLIPPMVRFNGQMTGIVRHFYIHFTLPYPFNNCPCGLQQNRIDTVFQPVIEVFFTLMDSPNPDKCTVLPVLGMIYKALARIPAEFWPAEIKDSRIRQVIDHLEHNSDRIISNSELAGLCGLSENGFIRLFSREVKLAPHQFHQTMRLNRACNLLSRKDLSIDTIAENCGFADRSHFSKAFKKQFNLSPGQFQRNPG